MISGAKQSRHRFQSNHVLFSVCDHQSMLITQRMVRLGKTLGATHHIEIILDGCHEVLFVCDTMGFHDNN